MKVTLSPDKILSTELDADYPKFINKPVNNKAGPKRVETKGKRVYKKMIDIAEKEEESQIIAPVMKTQEKTIAPVSKRAGLCTMRFHVTDATKNLASVKKMTQNGNRVVFDEERSYIQNKRTGQEMNLISEKGVYKLDVVFMNGEKAERGKIIIDSGAADNVMPANGLSEVPMREKERGVNFSAANGKPMANHGRKEWNSCPLNFGRQNTDTLFRGRPSESEFRGTQIHKTCNKDD